MLDRVRQKGSMTTTSAAILVAEDNTDDIELLRRAFDKAGLDNPVYYVRDGDEAIDFLKGHGSDACGPACPLLLFLDLNMPKCPGFEVLEWLHQQPHLRSLPTIVLSNSDERADIENSFR